MAKIQEIEVFEWETLDAIKEKADIIKVLGNLEFDPIMCVFCKIGNDYFELVYSDTEGNYIRHYPEEDLFSDALEKRKTEFGVYDEDESSELFDEF